MNQLRLPKLLNNTRPSNTNSSPTALSLASEFDIPCETCFQNNRAVVYIIGRYEYVKLFQNDNNTFNLTSDSFKYENLSFGRMRETIQYLIMNHMI